MQHRKLFLLSGLICGVTFLALLLVRTGVITFQKKTGTAANVVPVGSLAASDRWMNIYQGDRKIGMTHSRLIPTEDGYQMTEKVTMRINTMGLVQDLVIDSGAWLHPDLTLDRFTFTMHSGLFTFTARGQVEESRLICRIQSGGDERQIRVDLEAPPYFPAGIFPAVVKAGLAAGEQRVYPIFDPSTMAQEDITLTVQGRERISLGGKEVDALKVLLTFKGVSQEAWLDDRGQVLMEKGLLGIRQVKVSREEALADLPAAPSGDLTREVAVVPDRDIPAPAALNRLTLALSGVDLARFHLNEGRQHLEDNRLTLVREDLNDLPEVLMMDQLPLEVSAALEPSTFIQSGHPDIQDLAAQLVDPANTPLANTRRLVAWIQAHIERRPVLSLPDALATLENRMGDCNEHAVLMAALARAAGLPAQVEVGLVYHQGRFLYHAWNRIYVGRWVTVDALFNQIPADVSHVRFARGSAQDQLDILPLLGNLEIGVVAME